MQNTENYQDNWLPFTGKHDQFEYDVTLHDGTVIENCFEYQERLTSVSDAHNRLQITLSDIALIRFAQNPRAGIENEFSTATPDYAFIKRLENEIRNKRMFQSEKQREFRILNSMIGHSVELPQLNYERRGVGRSRRMGDIIGVRTEPKIGRNQLCKCKSGIKYKFCCGKK